MIVVCLMMPQKSKFVCMEWAMDAPSSLPLDVGDNVVC